MGYEVTENLKPRRRTRRAEGTRIFCQGGGEHKFEIHVYESYAKVTEALEEASARGWPSIELHRPDESMERPSRYNRGTDIYWNTIQDWTRPGTVLRVMVSQIVLWSPRLVSA